MSENHATQTIEEILAVAEQPAYRRAATARILLRSDLLQRHEDLEARLAGVTDISLDMSERQALAEELTELEAEIEASKVSFRFVAIGHRAWSDLLKTHAPSAQQKRDQPEVDFDLETFPAAAIAASCAEPKMDVAHVLRLEQTLAESQFGNLWGACCRANIGGGESPKSHLAGAIQRMREQSVSTPASEGSLDQSSSDE